MNKYLELKQKHENEVNNFPIIFAFSEKQFNEGLKKLGLKETDTDKIIPAFGGGYIKKIDSEKFTEMYEKYDAEEKEAIKNDIDGTGFIFDMFYYELCNHEYCYTLDTTDTLNCLEYTIEDIRADTRLLKGLNLAKEKCLAEDD